ncbi:MAG: Asp-tRNA(Asn)/Glu-tRNA(Gln) amidotransferase subunit GatA, partial [Gemmatimonadota bacterium]
SRLLENFHSPYDATVIERLEAAGAILLGKTNMDEFAMGSSTENSAFGPTSNPHDRERVSGGSSGGSAAAVASGYVPAGLGSETGGSVRQPAAFCGVVGIKPTYGRVSRYGLVAFGSSLDQIGTVGRTVEDAARILEAIAGSDPRDATTLPDAVGTLADALDEAGPDGLRIGWPGEYFGEGLDPEIRAACERARDRLESGGAEIVEISLPHAPYGIAVYYIVAIAEASSNLARYDGVRYGYRAAGADELRDMYTRTRAAFGAEVKRRIMLGTYVLSAGYYEAFYGKGTAVRARIRADFDAAWKRVDAVLTPTTPTPAFRLGEKIEDPLAMYLNDVYTVTANLAGIPALSVPLGRTAATGDRPALPIGVQLMGPPLAERRLFELARFLEREAA